MTVGLLRALGLPARYVSGYLHPKPDGRRSASRSPARATPGWSGGTAAGTASTRPTRVEIGPRHVTVGRGRDYGDVPPFKGLFSGPEERGPHGHRGGHPPRLTAGSVHETPEGILGPL